MSNDNSNSQSLRQQEEYFREYWQDLTLVSSEEVILHQPEHQQQQQQPKESEKRKKKKKKKKKKKNPEESIISTITEVSMGKEVIESLNQVEYIRINVLECVLYSILTKMIGTTTTKEDK